MHCSDLTTPAAIVDFERLERNCARMASRMAGLGVRLRPHVKTHKCVEAAREQVRGHFGGITVSTLAEARAFAAAGFRDITYAVSIAPQRIGEAVGLARQLVRFTVLTDSEGVVAELERGAQVQGLRLGLMLKVDCGSHRAGVDPDVQASVLLASRMAHSPWLDFRGILTHAGHSYRSRNAAEIVAAAEQERAVMVRFAQRLRAAAITVPEVSIGSTPTMSVVENLSGVSEARPGNYVFFDGHQAAIGSCTLDDVAFLVLATVIGCYPERGSLLLDAGALALSKDEGPRHVDQECGYGVLLDLGRRPLAGLRLRALSQEHGQVVGDPAVVAAHPVGSRMLIVPNHSCLAAALFDRYHVVRGGEVIGEWRPVRGW